MLDCRRLEDVSFQYAILEAASWYPYRFDTQSFPLHSSTMKIVAAKFTEKYHGAFMDRYSGNNANTCELTFLELICYFD